MRNNLLRFFSALILSGKLLCHWLFAVEADYKEVLRHFYYMSDWVAHCGLFLCFYVAGVRRTDRVLFLWFGVIYLIEAVYYGLYMFEVCPFQSGLESYSVMGVEVVVTGVFYFRKLFGGIFVRLIDFLNL